MFNNLFKGGNSELEKARQEGVDAIKRLQRREAEFRLLEKEFEKVNLQLQQTTAELETLKSQSSQEANDAIKRLESREAEFRLLHKEFEKVNLQLQQTTVELEALKKEFSNRKSDNSAEIARQLEQKQEELDSTYTELVATKEEIITILSQLEQKQEELNTNQNQLLTTREQLNGALIQLEEKQQQLEDYKTQLALTKEELNNTVIKLTQKEEKLNASQVQKEELENTASELDKTAKKWKKVKESPEKKSPVLELEYLPEDNNLLWGFSINSPQINQQVNTKKLMIKGWVLGKQSRANILRVKDDGQLVIKEVSINQTRNRIQQKFPDIAEAKNSGFETSLDLEKITTKQVFLETILDDGTCVSLGKIKINN